MSRRLRRRFPRDHWRGRFEPLEARRLLDAAPVDLVDDSFEVRQNSPFDQLNVLANDLFDSGYEGQQRISSVSYGSEGGTVEIAQDGRSILYAPPADFFGAEKLVYVVDSDHAAQVEVFVQAPLSFDEFDIPPDGHQRRLNVMDNDPFWPDYDGPQLITSISVTSAGGTVAIEQGQYSVLYTPPEGSFGKDEFIYIVDEIYPARVTISIPKTLEPDRFEVVQNTLNNVLPVLANDPFWPAYLGPGLITHLTDTDPKATVEISGDGRSAIYSPPSGQSGWDSFGYVVDATYEAVVSVIIHRPVRNDWFQLDKNSTNQLFNVTNNDTYRDLNRITRDVVDRVTSVGDPESGGIAAISANGQGVIYTPPQGFLGTDSFTYVADDLHEAQVTMQVTRPVRDDHISQGIYQDTPGAVLSVLANDFLGNGYTGPKRITGVGQTEHGGSVTINAFGWSLLYTPPPGYAGPDHFAYTVDEQLDANVTVTVQALAQNDYFNFCADPTAPPYTLNVLTNDHFRRGYPGPGVITDVSEALNGSEVTIAGGHLLFVPGPTGWDSVGYTVDHQYETTVHVPITGHLVGDLYVVDQNSPVRDLDVMNNDFSFDRRRDCKSQDYLGPRLITDVSESEHGGVVTVSEDGRSVHYQAPPDFHGDDSFIYTVDNLMQARAEVHVIRRVRDDLFRIGSDSGSESLPVLVNDLFGADYPGAQQITAVTETSAGATVAVGQNGQSIDYAPPPGFVGTDTFTYTVNGTLKAEVQVIVGSGRDERSPRFETLQAYQQFLIDDALIRYQYLFGQRAWFGCLACDFDEGAGPGRRATPDRSHSDTNVQVEGVDEGDIVEFDSDYVYMLTDEELVIVDAWPAQELSVASRVELEGSPKVEFLNGDRLTVISQIGGDIFPWQRSPGLGDLVSWPPYPVTPASTIVTVLDVTDRLEPTVVQTTTMEGRYVESRAIGDYVYVLVGNDNAVAPPPLLITEEAAAQDGSDPLAGDVIEPPDNGVYETEEEYLERVTVNLGQLVDDALPNYSSFGPDGELVRTGLLNESEGIVRPLFPDASNLISVVSLRVTANEPGLASTSGVYGSGASTVYASLDNFYVFDRDFSRQDGDLTRIMKFDWEAETGGVDFAAAGVVPGSILNQFSADECRSFLRIATTISNQWSGNWSGRPENTLFVIADDEGVFEFAGSLKNLALDETMRSIRYMGDRAFVTTFRDVDPLFGLDLSDPTNPRSVGYLTLPGFATYMQLIDETHLLTVGRNTPGGFNGPTQVSLFDFSDLGRPQRLGEHTFARFSTSEAELDHHAFGYFAEHGLLAIPVSRQYIQRIDTDGDGYRETRTTVREEQLAILDINPTAGPAANGVPDGAIQPVGKIPHDTPVRRSGYIGDKLYSIAVDSVKAVDVAEPGTVIGELIVVEDHDPDPPVSPGDDVNYPATLSTGPLASAIQRAQAHLAGDLQVGAGASMLVAAETARGGSRIVLRAADRQYLYREIEGEVVLTNDDYAFPDEGQNRVWHAIGPAPAPGSIVGRHIFYRDSLFDKVDNDAIATDKTLLLPGETAAFTNYTSYSRGINGIMVDIQNLPGDPTAADFELKVGNDNTPVDWQEVGVDPAIAVRASEGVDGSDRVVLTFPDNTIEKQWLQVTVLATQDTGLAEEDVFYFGNAIGESGNSAANAFVDGTDFAGARDNPHNFLNRVPIDDPFDFNRDSFVDGTDLAITRDNATNFLTALKLITAPLNSNIDSATTSVEALDTLKAAALVYLSTPEHAENISHTTRDKIVARWLSRTIGDVDLMSRVTKVRQPAWLSDNDNTVRLHVL